jgi:aryl carrier-like protein
MAPTKARSAGSTQPLPIKFETKKEPPKRFSDITLFLFGSGFAVFVALLGWSDQIRGLTRETYELQSEFLKTTNLTKTELLPVLRASTADEQLHAFTGLMQTNKLGADGVRLLPLLRNWRRHHGRLEQIQSWKYGLTVALSLTFFVCGGLVMAGCPDWIAALCPALVLMSLFVLIIVANVFERRLHSTLTQMMERI